jgi:hypothetical protein
VLGVDGQYSGRWAWYRHQHLSCRTRTEDGLHDWNRTPTGARGARALSGFALKALTEAGISSF